MKNVNYTPEATTAIVAAYAASPTIETVEKLAAEYNKPKKSIIGKLSREGVYQKTAYITKTGEKPVTKLELVAQISDHLGIEEGLEGLEKAPKSILQKLLENV